MKIMIGLPFGKPMEYESVKSLLQLAILKTDVQFTYRMVSNSLVYDARENLAQQCMDSDADCLFFLDSDMVIDPRTPLLLARHGKDIVTAKAFKRVPPYSPCFYTKLELKDDGQKVMEVPLRYTDGLLPIAGCGMACCLIHRSVFERVDKPWFFPSPGLGEDLSFCYQARQAGIKIYCDTTVQAGHLTTSPITEQDFQAYLQEQQDAGKTPAEVMS